MCDALDGTTKRLCPRPADWLVVVEATDERLRLCDHHAHLYNNETPIRYIPKNGGTHGTTRRRDH